MTSEATAHCRTDAEHAARPDGGTDAVHWWGTGPRPRYWWDSLTPAERAGFFRYFTPEQAEACVAESARKHGIPDKITDPEIVARVARIVTA